VATAVADGADRPVTYRVDVPGGTLHVTWDTEDHITLTGPAEIVARGTMDWTA
jgi:diaminopimelate epimerase